MKADYESLKRAAAIGEIGKLNMHSVFSEGQDRIKVKCPKCKGEIILAVKVRPERSSAVFFIPVPKSKREK